MSFYEHYDPCDVHDVKWDYCAACGMAYSQHEIDFESCTLAPTVGETLTGVTSGKTATVASSSKMNGTYAGGDARGTIVVTSPSGDFTDGESMNGSTSGSGFAVCRCYMDRDYGIKYPDFALMEFRGSKYCRPHFRAKQKILLDEQVVQFSKEET
jgi:hypothetical protein